MNTTIIIWTVPATHNHIKPFCIFNLHMLCHVQSQWPRSHFRYLFPEPALGIPKCSAREAIKNWTEHQHYSAWRDLPGVRNGKLFISGPCKKRADNLLKLSRPQLKMIVAILTGHTPVRKHLCVMGLFEGDPTCGFCKMEAETVQHIICYCEVLAHRRYNVFGRLIAKPKDISTTSIKDLCLFIRGAGLMNLCWMKCLGLHNKPMAEAHPEHMLTGPKEEEEEVAVIWKSQNIT